MTETKLFEVRDRGTTMPIMCARMLPPLDNEREYKLMRHSGFSDSPVCIFYIKMSTGGYSQYDPWEWGDRTNHVAHLHIEKNWEELVSGDIIDVEFIMGETTKIKETDI